MCMYVLCSFKRIFIPTIAYKIFGLTPLDFDLLQFFYILHKNVLCSQTLCHRITRKRKRLIYGEIQKNMSQDFISM